MTKIRIGIDIMGGDFAPQATTEGAILAQKELNHNVDLFLVGNEKVILSILKEKGVDCALFNIVNAPEVIEMGDHPTKAFAKKPVFLCRITSLNPEQSNATTGVPQLCASVAV